MINTVNLQHVFIFAVSKQIEDVADPSIRTYREKTETQDKTQAQPPKKKFAVCANKLSSSWSKAVYHSCVDGLVKDDPVASCQKILTSVGDELAFTFSSFTKLIDKLQTRAEGPSTQRASVSTQQQAEKLVKEAMDTNEELASIFLPSCDASADKPENVYKFDDLISPVEFEALESVSAAFKNITPEELQQMTEKKEHTLFVLQELRELKLAKDPDRQARVLWYLDMLIKFSQLKVAKRKDLITKGCPSIICGNLMKNFSVIVYKDGRVQNSISGTMKSKIVAYVIALALHISNFQVDLTCLQRDLRLTENR
ncbi:hypothetical protein AB205_0044270 [Aquarana catesbeiana]|uniref:Uncharacterized protein n=1 Tax=Aquarana catesbeiana TaxID=8400 RepID=A0A2G9NWL7_AQUCT|nr:hypothetical protein AB205_0044270 [Aquarana catesbeiana]